LAPPQHGLGDLDALVAEVRAAGQEVELVRERPGGTADDDVAAVVARTAYRVVQEGLTNARKHAPGERVVVRLAGDRRAGLTVEVTNRVVRRVSGTDGSAVDSAVESAVGSTVDSAVDGPAVGAAGAGVGLVGLGERVRLVGGRLEHGVLGGDAARAPHGAHGPDGAPTFTVRAWLPWQP
ncbi:hypothetical protein ICW40_10890, partial [Actinotalea ferrariae]|nr:hypothetical protein [Actinotalea ferrariae]